MFELVVVASAETEPLIPVLRDAEEGDDRIRAVLRDPLSVAYAASSDGLLVGAAVVREGEIVYIAIVEEHRRRGYGRQILDELKRANPGGLVVGTANSSLDNIAFYQRCGFRMLRVERDYFAYIDPPIVEHGIPMLDMIVFSYEK
ncbi:GNAT family N-acetyltransferase [Dactylosporangium vinaceum]|uniref:GNAT family N-acetyltransferase n=1 Tax=Dactylosporangium vinaceum TaxID=53362 RepID=A0ABV5M1I2_9ACTN|nr:GNAT family N-acetyltransferase [Dactylosporangium vinaceum]UAB99211.1 GNAT family N-acetyltransferase [Dactylosporangium vinaceum]